MWQEHETTVSQFVVGLVTATPDGKAHPENPEKKNIEIYKKLCLITFQVLKEVFTWLQIMFLFMLLVPTLDANGDFFCPCI